MLVPATYPQLDDLRLFCEVVRGGSLAAAAAALSASPSYVSKRLGILEQQLGVRLLHRTTRRLAVTEDGETVLRWARRLLADAEEMALEVKASRAEPEGLLRITASFGFGRCHVAPVVSEFAARHSQVEVRLDILDRPIDPVIEQVDVDVRLGGPLEPHLVAQKVADNHRVLCASPAYLAAHGMPQRLADLARHRCLVIRERDHVFGIWRLAGPGGEETVKVRGTLSANNGEIVHRWALDGHGIMLRSRWDVDTELAGGQLIQVLPAYRQQADIWAVMPYRPAQPPKVRLFVAFLRERMGTHPDHTPLA
ncbi:LysR family transcriptional regulator, transcriptional activator for dmlA [Oryzomicrobium terrae]|uniref:LysR family transcriptional regulator, transcriptional activator for dmlA n=1 Tax=Oryzomicrobium terrae TaxID=1735038 RepID=A0A5C1E9B3_9RHOO|nr:LysR family transcriptional regulator [Oryzomicrobium terrae]QEL65219.1 LysR family transcriptional regulator, transcriptional activator for dmlA [Oryzomicrobium terrae]